MSIRLKDAVGYFATSIPRRTLAALLSIFIVTYAGTAVLVYSGVRASMLRSQSAALNQLAELKYQRLSSEIDGLATDVTAWSRLDVMNDLVSGDIDQRVSKALEELRALYHLPGEIYAFDAKGALIAASSQTPAEKTGSRIPDSWAAGATALRLLPREHDLFSGVAGLAIAIPVYGSFDRSFRAGTLVLTYPWRSIEAELANPDASVALIEAGARNELLASAAQSRTGTAAPDEFILGRSSPGTGLTRNWQVTALQDEAVATEPLRRVVLELVLLGAFLSVPIILLGRLLSSRLTHPIAALTHAVQEIAATDRLEARVPVASADELGSLASSFNLMIGRLAKTTCEREQFVRDLAALNDTLETRIAERTKELKAAVEAQKRLIGDISHEIKSPLARLSMALGLARRKANRDTIRHFDRMESEIGSVSALASELLTLARLDRAALPPDFAPLDLGRLVEKIVTDAQFERPSRAPDIALRKPPAPLMVNGNSDFLRRAIENVVRNALFYTAENTPVEVTLSTGGDGWIWIEVRDFGSGVPDTALPHLFEPFYRVDAARARETGGTGIGLSICDRVLRLHGGTVSAANGDPPGLVITMSLPLLPFAAAQNSTEREGNSTRRAASQG